LTGKPTIPARTHAKIRALAKKGMGRREIAETVGHSLYTVRKALDPDFVEQERERQREFGAARYEIRKNDPNYAAYQAAYSATEERREQVRLHMAALRASQRASRP
jgi:hypothetical protein